MTTPDTRSASRRPGSLSLCPRQSSADFNWAASVLNTGPDPHSQSHSNPAAVGKQAKLSQSVCGWPWSDETSSGSWRWSVLGPASSWFPFPRRWWRRKSSLSSGLPKPLGLQAVAQEVEAIKGQREEAAPGVGEGGQGSRYPRVGSSGRRVCRRSEMVGEQTSSSGRGLGTG